MMMEKLVERLAGETEVLGEILPQCRFGKPATNRLSYGTAIHVSILSILIALYWLSSVPPDDLGLNRFLPSPFQSIMNLSSYHWTLRSLADIRVVKWPTEEDTAAHIALLRPQATIRSDFTRQNIKSVVTETAMSVKPETISKEVRKKEEERRRKERNDCFVTGSNQSL
jgi:hypothetical protein